MKRKGRSGRERAERAERTQGDMRETVGWLGEVYARNENNKGPTRGGEGEIREAVVAFRQVQQP